MRLYTSRYQATDLIRESGLVPVRITAGSPRFKLGYELGGSVMELAPDRWMFDLETDEEFCTAYTEKLGQVGVEAIRSKLGRIGQSRDLVLLCFEPSGEFCHRRVFAEWWERQTGEPVEELGPDNLPAREPGWEQMELLEEVGV